MRSTNQFPCSNKIRGFLLAGASSAVLAVGHIPLAAAEVGPPEKEELKFGFIKLTDMAPIAVAYEQGYFEDEGLYVSVEAQANWKVLLDGVIDGQLDGAHMLAGQPIAATIGFGTRADIVTPFSMDLNGNGITVSNADWAPAFAEAAGGGIGQFRYLTGRFGTEHRVNGGLGPPPGVE